MYSVKRKPKKSMMLSNLYGLNHGHLKGIVWLLVLLHSNVHELELFFINSLCHISIKPSDADVSNVVALS